MPFPFQPQLAGTSGGLTTAQAAEQALAQYAEEYLDVEIVGYKLNEEYRSGDTLYEVMDVSFRVRGRPGVFTVHPRYRHGWTDTAANEIAAKRDRVNAIYEGLAIITELTDVTFGKLYPALPS